MNQSERVQPAQGTFSSNAAMKLEPCCFHTPAKGASQGVRQGLQEDQGEWDEKGRGDHGGNGSAVVFHTRALSTY